MQTLRMAPLDPDEGRCEERILERLTGSHGAVDATVACRVAVRVTSRTRATTATLVEVAGGALALASDEPWSPSTSIVVEIADDDVCVRGVVRDAADGRVDVVLTERRHDGGEARLRAFLLAAIRRREV